MKKTIFIVILLLLTFLIFPSTSDEIKFKLNNFNLRISWHFSDKFIKFDNINVFYEILSLLYNNYGILNTNERYIWFDCVYSGKNNIFLVNYYNSSNFNDFSKVIKIELNSVDEIITFITNKLLLYGIKPFEYKKELTFYMISFPYKKIDDINLASIKYNKITDLLYGDSMSLQMNDSGYAFIYIYKKENLLSFLQQEFIDEKYFDTYIIDKKILSKDNINEMYFKTIIK